MASLRVSNFARTTVAPKPAPLPPRPTFATFSGSVRALAGELGLDVVDLFDKVSQEGTLQRPHPVTLSHELLVLFRSSGGKLSLSSDAVDQQLQMARILESSAQAQEEGLLPGRAANPIDLDTPDLARTFSDEEKATIWGRYDEVMRKICGGEAAFSPNRSSLSNLHAILFLGVKDYAGKVRSRDWGSDFIFLGSLRSLHRAEVDDALNRLFRFLSQASRQLAENKALALASKNDGDLAAIVAETCVVGAYTYLMLVQMQPFLDGNKRTSRLFIDTFLVSCGLPPLMSEIPEQVYTQAILQFFATRSTKVLQTAMADALNGLSSSLVPTTTEQE